MIECLVLLLALVEILTIGAWIRLLIIAVGFDLGIYHIYHTFTEHELPTKSLFWSFFLVLSFNYACWRPRAIVDKTIEITQKSL